MAIAFGCLFVFGCCGFFPFGNKFLIIQKKEYPWVPQNSAYCKIFGHSHLKCQAVNEMVDSGKTTCPDHIDMSPANGYVDAAGSSPVSGTVNADADIDNHITNPGKAGNVKVADISERLSCNTFECLAICDDAGNLEVGVERGPPKYGSPTIPVVSYTNIPDVISSFFFWIIKNLLPKRAKPQQTITMGAGVSLSLSPPKWGFRPSPLCGFRSLCRGTWVSR